ncbi:hypothetical protein Dimus_032531 [Dionaea muscipula]
MLGTGTHTLLGNNGSDSVASFVLSFDLSDEIYIETSLPPSDYCTKSECLLRHCPNHGATCALFFVSRQRFTGCVRPIEVWVLIGCGARSSWTKQIISLDCNLNRADWVYYKESLVSIPQISVKEGEGDCIKSDLHLSVIETREQTNS